MWSFIPIATLVVLASAHTIFQELWVDGVSQGHLNGIRTPESNLPLFNVSSNDMICNGGTNPLVHLSPIVIPVTTGSQITAEFHRSLNTDPQDPGDPISSSHKGPIFAYLARVPSATQPTVTGLKWFKIFQDTVDSKGQWGADRLILNHGKVNFTLPKCIVNGEYLLRVELIALHAAAVLDGAQLHPGCAQIKISGGGSASPATVSFPGAYSARDPGIYYNMFNNGKTYTAPGPSVFTC